MENEVKMIKLKVIVFDYDLTLYNVNENYHNNYWAEYTTQMIAELTQNMGQKNREKFIEKYQLNSDRSVENMARAFAGELGNCEQMVDYMLGHYFEQDYENMNYISPEIIKKLSEKYNLYIISNAPSSNIIRQLRDIAGINPKYFKGIFTNRHKSEDNTKGFLLNEIMRLEKVLPSEMLMLGDKVDVDIEPAKKLGINAELVKSLDEILPKIEKIENCIK